MLEKALTDIEAHVHAGGWDRPPALFALVRAQQFAADDPVTAAKLGLDDVAPDALTPVEQEALPDGPLDEVLAEIGWPDSVAGCALAQEILMLPPEAEADLAGSGSEWDADSEITQRAAEHPQRREARLVVGVLRDGTSAAVLRVRAAGAIDTNSGGNSDSNSGGNTDSEPGAAVDELLTGPDLAPNLTEALLATLS